MTSSGYDGDVVVHNLLVGEGGHAQGFDALTGEYTDLVVQGVSC